MTDAPRPVWLTRQQIDQIMTDSRPDRELHDVLRAALDQETHITPTAWKIEADARRWLTEHGKHGLSYVDGEVVPGTSELFTPAIGQGRWTCWWVPDPADPTGGEQ